MIRKRNRNCCRKWLLRIAAVSGGLVILGLACLGTVNFYVKHSAGKRIATLGKLLENLEENTEEKADAVLVLGAKVKANGEMSPMLKERVDLGIEIYQKGLAKKIIMSGDHGREDYDEVNTMKSYAVEQGVPSEDIFMDHAGFSTYESMYRAKEIFQTDTVIVVTQKYHLYRAIYDAQAFSMKATGVACDQAVYHGDRYRKLREMLARVKDFGYTILKPEPTFLGDVIPVSGNGNLTNDIGYTKQGGRVYEGN